MKKCFIFLIAILSGCIAKQLQYAPGYIESEDLATRVIEQVVMEQPLKYRPEGMVITDSYLGFSEGYEAKSTIVSAYSDITTVILSSSNIKLSDINSRYYFNSIAELEIYNKRDWFIIQIKDKDQGVVKRFYTRSLDKAQRFVDSINYMIITSKPFGVD